MIKRKSQSYLLEYLISYNSYDFIVSFILISKGRNNIEDEGCSYLTQSNWRNLEIIDLST